MKTYTKESLQTELVAIRNRGPVLNTRGNNHGAPGNVLEDLLGVEENNLPIPNCAEWELKTQRASSRSLTTLLHSEPSPMALKFVPSILLPNYGWKHQKAGNGYPDSEKSFRQTINAGGRTDRGFGIVIDREKRKLSVSFDSATVSVRHSAWLNQVTTRVGAGELDPAPYFGGLMISSIEPEQSSETVFMRKQRS